MKILFVNACVREESRTKRLADRLLLSLKGDIEEVKLKSENIPPLDEEGLKERDSLIRKGDFSDPSLRYGKQLSEADIVVIAAPLWDYSFPACLKCYIERVMVPEITFRYESGRPRGLCKAKKLYYVTTCGGEYIADYGFNYIKSVANDFWGIPEVSSVVASGLDIRGADPERIIESVVF